MARPEPTLAIRSYQESDEDGVVAVWRLAFPGDPQRNEPRAVIRRKLGVGRELFLVAVAGDRVVGTVVGGWDGFRGWMNHLAVHPRHRRQGVGRRLVAALEAALKALGCPKLNLQVRAGNEVVVGFYERLGYAVEERVSMGKLIE